MTIKCCLCEKVICKYRMDVTACGGVYHSKDKIICEDCAKYVAKELIEK